jgi:hypothetical protein
MSDPDHDSARAADDEVARCVDAIMAGASGVSHHPDIVAAALWQSVAAFYARLAHECGESRWWAGHALLTAALDAARLSMELDGRPPALN